ncbi:TPA: hypothetical protein UMB92_000330 [Stenotrophomonas maltophilia]|nr:hypothetical protein [Stenotrophomonas maltophilia]
MGKGKLLALALGACISATAIACATMSELKVNGLVVVDFSDLEFERWEKISTALWAWYGDQYKDVYIASVNVPVRHCVLGFCQDFERSFTKPCGEQLGFRAWVISDLAKPYVDNGGGAGGGDLGGVGPDPGGGGFGGSNCTVHPKTGQACTKVGGGAQICETYDATYVTCV